MINLIRRNGVVKLNTHIKEKIRAGACLIKYPNQEPQLGRGCPPVELDQFTQHRIVTKHQPVGLKKPWRNSSFVSESNCIRT